MIVANSTKWISKLATLPDPTKDASGVQHGVIELGDHNFGEISCCVHRLLQEAVKHTASDDESDGEGRAKKAVELIFRCNVLFIVGFE